MSIRGWKGTCCGRRIEAELILQDFMPFLRVVTCRLLVDDKKVKESVKSTFILLNPVGAGNPIAAMIEGDDGKQHLIEVQFPNTWTHGCRMFLDGEPFEEE